MPVQTPIPKKEMKNKHPFPRLTSIGLALLTPARLRALLVGAALLGAAAAGHGATLNFNGAAQHITVTAPNLTLSSNVTFEAWVKPRTSKCNTILSRGPGNTTATDFIFQLGYDGGSCNSRLVGFFGAGVWDTSLTPVPLNEWTHVAVTYDGAVKRFYINGVLDRTVSRTGQLFQSNDPLLFVGRQGASCNCNFFDGELDEVRVWDVPRGESQIQAVRNIRLARNEPGLVAYYPMEEGAGAVTAYATGRDNTGILINGPRWNRTEDAVAPAVLTVTATLVTNTSVRLNALVNPNSATTSNRFEWGAASTALNFDGVNDYVGVPDFGSQMPTTEVTVEFWQRVRSVKAQSTFSMDPDSAGNRFTADVPWSDGRVYWDFGNINGGGRLSYVPPESIVGTWQHFAMVSSVSGNYMRIYRNGVLEAAKPGASPFTGSIKDLTLGTSINYVTNVFCDLFGGNCVVFSINDVSAYYGGELDEFRIWNVARTGSQVRADMNTRLAGNETGLVAYYPMPAAAGTPAPSGTTPAGLLELGPCSTR